MAGPEQNKAVFEYKPIHLQELKETALRAEAAKEFQVEKVVELKPDDFAVFSQELYEYYSFLYDNGEYMYFDDREHCFHCLLVTTPDRKEGILAEAEGYAYARYCAYIPDCRKLDLKDIEIIKIEMLSHKIPVGYWQKPSIGGHPERQVR